MTRLASLTAAGLATVLAAGCATYVPAPPQHAPVRTAPAARVEYGRIHSIDLIRGANQTTGAGGVIGGMAGAVVGHQLGSGSGRMAGTLVGAVAGAILGNEIERQNRGAQDVYRVVVRTDRGQFRVFDYSQLTGVRVGDRVRIENNLVYRA